MAKKTIFYLGDDDISLHQHITNTKVSFCQKVLESFFGVFNF